MVFVRCIFPIDAPHATNDEVKRRMIRAQLTIEELKHTAGRVYLTGLESVFSVYRGKPPVLVVKRVATQRAFLEYTTQMHTENVRRSENERALAEGRDRIETRGYCSVCSRWTTFFSSWAYGFESEGRRQLNWREHLVCPHCGLNNRMRASMHLLAEVGAPLATSRVYATEQVTRLFEQLKMRASSAVGSEFLGDGFAPGETNSNGIMNQDLTRLTFADGEFDLILSFEVLEHIPHYRKAFQECVRVLKPRGKMLFSAPFDVHAARNLIRARVREDGTIEHLEPAEYHGDPLSDAGCLCFQHFGWEIIDELKQAGFRNATALPYYSPEWGYLGGQQIQFLAEK